MTTESRAAHTPGPWQVKPSPYAGGVLLVQAGMPTNRVLARFGDDGEEIDAIDKANARLIAAAPTMLAALELLLREAVILSDDYLSAFHHYANDATIQGWDKARWLRASAAAKAARAAIAKAIASTLPVEETTER